MQQMEWHEALEELASHPNPANYIALTKQFDETRHAFVQTLTELFEKQQFDQAAARVREWMFLDKLITQLKQTHGVTADL
jgi:molecular chaperone HscB